MIDTETGAYIYTLANGDEMLVDLEDKHLLDNHLISYRGEGFVYAVIHIENKRIAFARYLLNCPDDMFVDHINRDTLDNRRCNLRIVTQGENNFNRGNWGKYPKGISFDEKKQLYRARIQFCGRRFGLGRYKKLQDAVVAYATAAKELYGEYNE